MTTRRSFLKQASLASAPFILPSHVWAAKGDEAPNNRINVAIIGPGKMGRGHAHKLIRNPGPKSPVSLKSPTFAPSTPRNSSRSIMPSTPLPGLGTD